MRLVWKRPLLHASAGTRIGKYGMPYLAGSRTLGFDSKFRTRRWNRPVEGAPVGSTLPAGMTVTPKSRWSSRTDPPYSWRPATPTVLRVILLCPTRLPFLTPSTTCSKVTMQNTIHPRLIHVANVKGARPVAEHESYSKIIPTRLVGSIVYLSPCSSSG